MKGFIKLFPAALAVFALASCSDVIETEKNSQIAAVEQKGDLRLSFDAFDNDVATRAMRDNNFGTLTFIDGDQVNVYSEDLYKTDWYVFDTDAFYYGSEGEKMVDNPKFGVMPGGDIKKAYIDRKTRTTRVDMEIPTTITYGAKSETTIDGKAMYACNLPAFGYASLNPEGYVEVANLRYMVGILKVNLEKVVSNASWLRLINYGQGGNPSKILGSDDDSGLDWATAKPLSGIMTAELYGDESKRKEVKLAAIDETLSATWRPYIYIDLRSVASNTSCIYIPVVPGLDGDVDNIRLEYSKELGDNPESFTHSQWVNIPGMAFPGKEFKQHSRYSGSYAFEFENMNPYLVSTILSQYESTNDDIDINITKTFSINAADPTIDNIIYVPNFENDVDVNITLADGFTTWTKTGTKALRIQDADPENPFTGTITLNYGDAIKSQAADEANVHVDLKAGKAIIAGEFTNPQKINPIAGNIQIGDGENTTSGFTWGSAGIGNDVLSITIAEEATMTADIDCSAADNQTKSVVVAGALTGVISVSPSATADAKTTVDVSGTLTNTGADAIVGTANDLFVDVNVSGKVDGNINLPGAVKGKITVTSGDEADANAKFVTGDVTMKGDVEVALTEEGEAIAGKLSMLGAAKTLTLKQGYIKEIVVNVQNAGSWEDKYINVVLNEKLADDEDGNAVYGKTAFLTLTETEGVAKFTESVWGGTKITNTTYKDKFTTKGTENYDIFTAAQLASFNVVIGGTNILCNDINLNAKTWTGYTVKNSFAGADLTNTRVTANSETKYPVISNLVVKDGTGLFTETAGDLTVSNLTFNGVTGAPDAAATTGMGALFAEVKHATTIENVTVKGLNIVAAAPTTGTNAGIIAEMQNVGGIAGINSAALTLKKVSTAGTITGYANLGGFVGKASEAVNIGDAADGSTTCTSSVTLSANFDSKKAMDMNYARMGGFIGTVTGTKNVTIKDGSNATSSSITGKANVMYLSDKSAGVGNFFNFAQDQKFVGFSGTNEHDGGEYAQSYGIIKEYSSATAFVTYVEPFFGTADKYKADKTKTIGDAADATTKDLRVLYHFTKK